MSSRKVYGAITETSIVKNLKEDNYSKAKDLIKFAIAKTYKLYNLAIILFLSGSTGRTHNHLRTQRCKSLRDK